MTEPTAGKPPAPTYFSPDKLGQGLLNAMVGEMKSAPNMWAKMSESQQEVVIRRLEVAVRIWTLETMRILFSAKVPAVAATLEGVTFKDAIKASLEVARDAPDRHEFADRVNQQVVVVMVNADAYFDRMNEVRADSAQRKLFDDNGEIPGSTSQPPEPEGGGGGSSGGETFDATAQAEALAKIFNLPPEDSHSPKAEDFIAQLSQDLIGRGAVIPENFLLISIETDGLIEIRAFLDGLIPHLLSNWPDWLKAIDPIDSTTTGEPTMQATEKHKPADEADDGGGTAGEGGQPQPTPPAETEAEGADVTLEGDDDEDDDDDDEE